MTPIALGLVLAAALNHAFWNLLAKRAAGGAAFVWLVSAISAVAYAPAALVEYTLRSPHVGAGGGRAHGGERVSTDGLLPVAPARLPRG